MREEGEEERKGKKREGKEEMINHGVYFMSNNYRMPKISVLQEFLSEAGFGLGSGMVLPLAFKQIFDSRLRIKVTAL